MTILQTDFSRAAGGGFAFGGGDFQFPSYDPDSLAFFTRAQVTDPVVMRRHDALVRHAKATGQWAALNPWYGADAGALKSVAPDVVAAPEDPVRRWLNRRVDNYHAEQTVTLGQPVYKAATGPGGSPAIYSDGVNPYMAATIPSIPTPFTLLVFRVGGASSNPSWQILFGSWVTSSSAALIDPPDTRRGLGQPWATPIPGLYVRTGAQVLAASVNGASSFFYRSGQSAITGTVAETANIGTTLKLFGNEVTSHCSSSHASHMMVFNTALTLSQIQGWRDKFSQLYGGL